MDAPARGDMKQHQLSIYGLSFMCLVLCACFFFAACQQQKAETEPAIKVEYEITPQPPRIGAAVITLRLADVTGQPLSGVRVSVEGNMSHAGMRPVFGEAREAEPGRYQAAIEFTMSGDWIILLHLTLPDGSKVERQLEVMGVRAS